MHLQLVDLLRGERQKLAVGHAAFFFVQADLELDLSRDGLKLALLLGEPFIPAIEGRLERQVAVDAGLGFARLSRHGRLNLRDHPTEVAGSLRAGHQHALVVGKEPVGVVQHLRGDQRLRTLGETHERGVVVLQELHGTLGCGHPGGQRTPDGEQRLLDVLVETKRRLHRIHVERLTKRVHERPCRARRHFRAASASSNVPKLLAA